MRVLQTPPLALGGIYAYTIKATWHGKTVTRDIRVRTGERTVVDLRDALQTAAAPAPLATIALQVPATLTLTAGQSTHLQIRVRRTRYTGPVMVRLTGLPKGVASGEATIAAGGDEAEVLVVVAPDAAVLTHDVLVTGMGSQVVAMASVQLVIVRPKPASVAPPKLAKPAPAPVPVVPPKMDKQPPTPTPVPVPQPVPPKPTPKVKVTPPTPPTPPVAAVPEVSVQPPELVLAPGESRMVHVEVRLSGLGKMEAAPGIAIEGARDTGINLAGWASRMTSDQTAYTRDYAVQVAAAAPDGTRNVRIVATTPGGSCSGALNITVKSKPQPAKPAPSVEAVPEVSVQPPDLVLAPGEWRMVHVEVRLLGPGKIEAVPGIAFEGARGAGINLAGWASRMTSDQTAYTKDYSVRVAADAPEGMRTVQIVATTRGGSASGTLKITVKKPADAPVVKARPGPELQAMLIPGELILAPGETRRVLLRVQAVGAAGLAVAPTVDVDPSIGDAVQVAVWSSRFAADGTSYAKEYAVRAATDAAATSQPVRFIVRGGGRETVATLTIRVTKPAATP